MVTLEEQLAKLARTQTFLNNTYSMNYGQSALGYTSKATPAAIQQEALRATNAYTGNIGVSNFNPISIIDFTTQPQPTGPPNYGTIPSNPTGPHQPATNQTVTNEPITNTSTPGIVTSSIMPSLSFLKSINPLYLVGGAIVLVLLLKK